MSIDTSTEELVIPEGYGLLSILDSTGDTRIMWNPRDKDDVASAEAAWDAAKKRGMVAYFVGDNGEAGEVIQGTKFPKKEGKIIMAPQLVGG